MLAGGFDPPRTKRRARQVREDVGNLELDPAVQARMDGYYRNGERIGTTTIRVSPLLQDKEITLDSFPDGFTFGNDGTNASVPLHGKLVPLAWQVWPLGTELTDQQFYRLREIFEGIPPGNPERHVWVPAEQFDCSR